MIDNLVKQLSELHGPSGFEQRVSYFIHDYVKEKVDSVEIDAVGNVIARKKDPSKDQSHYLLQTWMK